MAGFEYRSGGRRVSAEQFWEGASDQLLDRAFVVMTERFRGAAAAIVDPATGRHAAVFVRRVGDALKLSTEGSPAFARELERRLGVDKGMIETVTATTTAASPQVYLAHSSKDKDDLARPLAKRLNAAGIDVWFDEWEIATGDSLKTRMEQGLEDCTHFVVLLTPNSIGAPWVEAEIDAGFLKSVGGSAKFMGLRVGVGVDQLSIFLRTRRCREVDMNDDDGVRRLIAEIYGVTAKPLRGERPAYVDAAPPGWSLGAARVAEYLVRGSVNGTPQDPTARIAAIAEATGLAPEDVRLGALDLQDSGLIARSGEINSSMIWPLRGLFVEFDQHVLGLYSKTDALALANRVISEGYEGVTLDENIFDWFPDWTVRRLNSALNYLEDADLVDASHTLCERPFAMREFFVTDRTRRFVRDHG